MDEDLYKVCPECGGEYQHTVEFCVDCGVPLVFPEEIAARDARELSLSPGLVRVRTAPILWVRALAADLDRAGIPYAIDRRKARETGLLGLFVHRRDHEAAVALDGARARIDPLPEAEDPAAAHGEEEEEDEDVAEPDYKVCPQCGGEYRLEIGRCADCGVELVWPGEVEREAERAEAEMPDLDLREREEMARSFLQEPPRHELPASDELVCLCCVSFTSLADLSARLDAAGLGHRIERGPFEKTSTRACLYLLPKDCDAAERLWGSAEPPAAVRVCPACGVSLLREASACPGCGLEFPNPEAACPRCGAVVTGWSTGCPNCGSDIAGSEPALPLE